MNQLSTMEILALALHILLGLVNRLSGVARPSQNATIRYDRLLNNNTVKLCKDAKYIDLSTGMAL